MKSKLLIFLSVFSLQLTISQNYQTVEEVNDACATLGFSGDEDAEIAVDAILDKMGLYRNFVIQECPDINNAVAKNIDIGSGKKERYILYDNDFFNKIDIKAGNDWAATSVLAHEIGHHLNGHALNDEGSNHKWELEADEFSGFVLARMGTTLDDAQSAIQTLKYVKATSTHPAKADRLLAIEKGYNRGLGKTIVVKKIDDEIIKDITENKKEEIINNEAEENYIAVDGITSEQIFSKYIDAIGGQEKIMNIKTLIQSYTRSSFSVTNGETREDKYDITALTPNKNIYSYYSKDGRIYSTLELDGKEYTKIGKGKRKGKGKWTLSTDEPINIFLENSYINEYSWLVTNIEAVFLGMKSIEGISCYAIEIPKTEIVTGNEVVSFKLSTHKTNYYSIDTGLLAFTKTTHILDMDYKEESEYLKDSKTTDTEITSYLDYKPVKGVLFPFRMESKVLESTTSTITEYTDIQVNPIINKEDFKVND
jgi:hypothetical protein